MSTTGKSTSKRGKTTKRRAANQPDEIIEIEVINRQRLYPVDRNAIAKLSGAVLDRIGRSEDVLTITFIRDRAMRRLNRDYRGIDKPTDVLSFSYHEGSYHEASYHDSSYHDSSYHEGSDLGGDETSGIWNDSRHLGDVVISVETAERYARDLNLSFDREIDHLVIHGALHLAGYDHETDKGEMKKLERKLRKELLS